MPPGGPSSDGLLEADNITLSFGSILSGTAPIVPNAVPEPSSLAICGIAGLIGLGYARRRRVLAA